MFFLAYINTICLPTRDDLKLMDRNRRFIIAGWGKTHNSARSNSLIKATIPRKSTQFCNSILNTDISEESIICAGGENQVDACVGDSGGPLFWIAKVNQGTRFIQHGITVAGAPFCGRTFNRITPPSLYTNVASHIDWIKNNMK